MSRRGLMICNTFVNGGIEKVVIDICKNIYNEKVQFDLLLIDGEMKCYKDEFEKLGGKVYSFKLPIVKNKVLSIIIQFLANQYNIIKVLKGNKYDIVHSHNTGNMGGVMLASYLCRVPIRILHSHCANLENRSKKELVFNYFFAKFINLLVTHKIGCSDAACEWMFGQNWENDKKVMTIYNGVDLEKFNINRYKAQSDKNINEKIEFVHVGRFEDVKNHIFLIDVFKKIHAKNVNTKLTLVGYGSLEKVIKEKIIDSKLEKTIEILPGNSNIPEVLSEMNYVIFPSKYEGFSIFLVECQAMNLSCFVSSVITKESDLGLCKFIDLDKGEEYWADYILEFIANNKTTKEPDLTKVDLKEIIKKYGSIYNGYI